MMDLSPTIVLIDTPHDERIPAERSKSRSPSPRSLPPSEADDNPAAHRADLYGLRLLQKIVSEAHLRNLSKLVVPIPVVSFPPPIGPQDELEVRLDDCPDSNRPALDRRLLQRCLDLGATSVLVSPIPASSVTALQVHAYQAHMDAAKDQQGAARTAARKKTVVGRHKRRQAICIPA